MSDVIDNSTATGITTAIIGAVIYFVRVLIRRGAKDVSEIKNEMSQTSYVEVLRKDNELLRDDITILAKERNDALSKIGALEAELAIIKGQCERKALLLDNCPVINDVKKPRLPR